MIAIGADRFCSKAAASPEFGAGSGGDMDDISKQLGSIEKAVARLEAALPYLATKAELQSLRVEVEALRADLIKWIVGAALSSVAAATAVTTLASRVSWH
jgi:hypothetical protein